MPGNKRPKATRKGWLYNIHRLVEAPLAGLHGQVFWLKAAMLSAAKHLVCRVIHSSRPQMLRCAQHDRLDGERHEKTYLCHSWRVAFGSSHSTASGFYWPPTAIKSSSSTTTTSSSSWWLHAYTKARRRQALVVSFL